MDRRGGRLRDDPPLHLCPQIAPACRTSSSATPAAWRSGTPTSAVSACPARGARIRAGSRDFRLPPPSLGPARHGRGAHTGGRLRPDPDPTCLRSPRPSSNRRRGWTRQGRSAGSSSTFARAPAVAQGESRRRLAPGRYFSLTGDALSGARRAVHGDPGRARGAPARDDGRRRRRSRRLPEPLLVRAGRRDPAAEAPAAAHPAGDGDGHRHRARRAGDPHRRARPRQGPVPLGSPGAPATSTACWIRTMQGWAGTGPAPSSSRASGWR